MSRRAAVPSARAWAAGSSRPEAAPSPRAAGSSCPAASPAAGPEAAPCLAPARPAPAEPEPVGPVAGAAVVPAREAADPAGVEADPASGAAGSSVPGRTGATRARAGARPVRRSVRPIASPGRHPRCLPSPETIQSKRAPQPPRDPLCTTSLSRCGCPPLPSPSVPIIGRLPKGLGPAHADPAARRCHDGRQHLRDHPRGDRSTPDRSHHVGGRRAPAYPQSVGNRPMIGRGRRAAWGRGRAAVRW